jgi:hypothetical protein
LEDRIDAEHPEILKWPISGPVSSHHCLNLHQNPGETLHIRRLENGLERPGSRSRPTPWRFASLVGTDAFAGALTHGSFKAIPRDYATHVKAEVTAGLNETEAFSLAKSAADRAKVYRVPDQAPLSWWAIWKRR